MEKSEIETIYRKYFHDVFLYIRALSENESLAEEITQETFLKAMNNIEKFDGRKDIRAWLFVIAKNTYFRYCRRNKIYVVEEFSEIMQDSMQDTSEKCRMGKSDLPSCTPDDKSTDESGGKVTWKK